MTTPQHLAGSSSLPKESLLFVKSVIGCGEVPRVAEESKERKAERKKGKL